MRVFVVSDIHIDYQENRRWVSALSSHDYSEDILIVAGDISDDVQLLKACFRELAAKFQDVLFIPGNHELWVLRDGIADSLQKFQQVCDLATDEGISLQPFHRNQLSVVPLHSWYDFSFGEPSTKLMQVWADFHACDWPDHWQAADIAGHFLQKNTDHLLTKNETVISFSHFLPRIDLMPAYIPEQYRYLYPVLGCASLEDQIRQLGPDIHVYGHSHVNRRVTVQGIRYINNAFGYPSESGMTGRKLLCIHEQ